MNDDETSLVIRINNAIVSSDYHVPHYSREWVNNMVQYARRNEAKALVIGGDLFDFDGLSDFAHPDKYDLGAELAAGKELLARLLDAFQLIAICKGNHSERILGALRNNLTFKEFIRSLNDSRRIQVTDNDYLHLVSSGVSFRVAHPRQYSPIKGKVVTGLAHSLQEHLLIGHGHNLALAYDHTGRHICMDLGTMVDPRKIVYKTSKTNSYPAFDNGFAHVMNGKVRMISRLTF